MGGMEMGSVWGHGSYVAPDWTADWLHRESMYILNSWSVTEYGKDYNSIDEESRAKLRARLTDLMKAGTYDKTTNTITVDSIRAEAIKANTRYYSELFTNGNEDYALPANTLTDGEKLRLLSGFFFWSSWAAAATDPVKI